MRRPGGPPLIPDKHLIALDAFFRKHPKAKEAGEMYTRKGRHSLFLLRRQVQAMVRYRRKMPD